MLTLLLSLTGIEHVKEERKSQHLSIVSFNGSAKNKMNPMVLLCPHILHTYGLSLNNVVI